MISKAVASETARAEKAARAQKLIDAAGGIDAFGRLLGIDSQKFFRQRVSNWRRRGLPPEVELDHYDVLQRLRRAADQSRVA